jgi:hypothetical protein
MKKAIGIIVFGLLLSGCATLNYKESQSSYGGTVTNHFSWGVSQAELQRRATIQCQTYKPNSTAVMNRRYKGGLLKIGGEGGEYDIWDYKCLSQATIQAERQEENKVQLASMVYRAKDTCKTLGFTEGTEKFSDCSLKLYSQSVELAAANNQQVVIQGSGSNVMTIYDPVRDNNALIKRGQGLINGTCTLANLSTC